MILRVDRTPRQRWCKPDEQDTPGKQIYSRGPKQLLRASEVNCMRRAPNRIVRQILLLYYFQGRDVVRSLLYGEPPALRLITCFSVLPHAFKPFTIIVFCAMSDVRKSRSFRNSDECRYDLLSVTPALHVR